MVFGKYSTAATLAFALWEYDSDLGWPMNVDTSMDSTDGGLGVKLVEYEPETGRGRIQIIELSQEHARYYVTVRYGGNNSGQTRIDYKTYDLRKATAFPFQALPHDDVTDITIVAVPAN
jgi:hypothetical protein